MTNEKVIEILKGAIKKPNTKDGYLGQALDIAIKALEQTTWTPVSERLPEAFRFVNCTCHSLIDDREDWVVETCYLPQLPDSPYSDWGNIPMLNMGDCEVVAWMYRDIPKPYKVEPQERSDKCSKCEYYINPDYTRCHECKAESEDKE